VNKLKKKEALLGHLKFIIWLHIETHIITKKLIFEKNLMLTKTAFI